MEGYIIIFVLTKSPARINLLYCNDGRIRVDIKVIFGVFAAVAQMFTGPGS
jgi:hypothetical protein